MWQLFIYEAEKLLLPEWMAANGVQEQDLEMRGQNLERKLALDL